MCYTTDEYVDIKREVSSQDAYGINGFRANCNDIPVNGWIFANKCIITLSISLYYDCHK